MTEVDEKESMKQSKSKPVSKNTRATGPFPTGVPQFFRYVPQSEEVKSSPMESLGLASKPRKSLFMAPTLGKRHGQSPASATSNNTDELPYPFVPIYYDLKSYSSSTPSTSNQIKTEDGASSLISRQQNPLLMRFNLPKEEDKQTERRKSNAATMSTGFGFSVQLLLSAKRVAKKAKNLSSTKRRSIFLK